MSAQQRLADLSRPWRRGLARRLSPSNFKEFYINQALDVRPNPTLYVEIGVRRGESFRRARANAKIGVDPVQTKEMTGSRVGERFFPVPSDTFFRDHALSVMNPLSIDVALLDGLHEFRQTLRDFLHLEPYMSPDGFIVLDDCNPLTEERGSPTPTGRAWNGDVWKVAAYLTTRSDLTFATIDADQGVGLVTGFGASPGWPSEEEVLRLNALPYSHLVANRAALLNLIPRAEARRLFGFRH